MKQSHDDIAGMALELGRLIRKAMVTHGGDEQSPVRTHALCFISERPGMRMSELASLMKISPSTATVFIDKLTRAKLVRRTTDTRNRKIVCLQLTPLGAKTVARYHKMKHLVLKKVFAGLTAADQAHLHRIFSLLLSAASPSSHD